jgi:AraC family transcriptional regulator
VSGVRCYGDAVAHSFKLRPSVKFVTRSLGESKIAVSKLSLGVEQLGMSPRIPPEDTFIAAIYLSKVPHHELWSRGRPVIAQGYDRNAMRIVNLADEFSAKIIYPHESLVFYIPRAALDEFAEDTGARRVSDLACAPGVVDPVVTQLAGALLPAFSGPKEASALFVDHVTLAVCAHLAEAYGGFTPPRDFLKGRLSPSQARRAKEFMSAHCADGIALADIAQVCNLSRSYFIKAFRTTTGLTPHQWLQKRRVELAQSMMLESSSPIAEIAAGCGFADQSHMTRVFSRIVGLSPAAWRRLRQSSGNDDEGAA